MATFGEILRALREERGETQEYIASHICVSRSAISKYEKNEREPDIKVLMALADHFGVSIDYLIGKTAIRGKQDYIPHNLKLIMGDKTVEEFVEEIRRKIGITIDVNDLQHYLAGFSAPPVGVLQALADYAGVDIEFFYKKNSEECLEKIRTKEGKRLFMPMVMKDRAFIRLAEKIVRHDLDVETVEKLIDSAIEIKKAARP